MAEQVEVQVAASSSGLGACLMQGGQPIQFVSRALKNATAKLRKRCLVLHVGSLDFIPALMVGKRQSITTTNPLLQY